MPRLSVEESKRCDGFLTKGECFQSLKTMGNNKTPGNDGLTKEFYLAFWGMLGDDMVDSFNFSFQNGKLSMSQRQVTLTLLEKQNRDTRYLENWRPISLINVDVKVCSKAISERVKNFLPQLVHPTH